MHFFAFACRQGCRTTQHRGPNQGEPTKGPYRRPVAQSDLPMHADLSPVQVLGATACHACDLSDTAADDCGGGASGDEMAGLATPPPATDEGLPSAGDSPDEREGDGDDGDGQRRLADAGLASLKGIGLIIPSHSLAPAAVKASSPAACSGACRSHTAAEDIWYRLSSMAAASVAQTAKAYSESRSHSVTRDPALSIGIDAERRQGGQFGGEDGTRALTSGGGSEGSGDDQTLDDGIDKHDGVDWRDWANSEFGSYASRGRGGARAALCGIGNTAGYGPCVASTFRRLAVEGLPVSAAPGHAGLLIEVRVLKLDAYGQARLPLSLLLFSSSSSHSPLISSYRLFHPTLSFLLARSLLQLLLH